MSGISKRVAGGVGASLAVAVLILVGTPAADAGSITSLAEMNGNTTTSSGPPPDGVMSLLEDGTGGSTDINFSVGDPAFSVAAVNVGGYSATEVSGGWWNGVAPNTQAAKVTYEESVQNSSAGARAYFYDFFITPARLAISGAFDNITPSTPDAPTSEYYIEIRWNGSSVFSSGARLVGGLGGHSLTETGTDLGGTLYGPLGFGEFGYEFDFFTTELSLGVLNPGETGTLWYTMGVNTTVPGYEVGAAAGIGDPYDLDNEGGLGGVVDSNPLGGPGPGGVVPLPSAVWVGLSMIGILGGTRRLWRKK